MSTYNASSMKIIIQQITADVGIFLLIVGMLGGLLNIIIFLSLTTFRQSSCAFYLTIMSIVNILHLCTGLLTYMMINGFSINWTDMSPFYCKFRPFYVQICVLMSFTSMCLAVIDQFLATCSHPRWHRWNNIKLARYIMIGAVIICILHGIPCILYYNHVLSSITSEYNCLITNMIFQKYTTVIYLPVLISGLPVLIMIFFGSLAYRNVQQITYRTVPLARRELDKQLTVMVLVEVFYNVLAVTPMIIQSICSIIINAPRDSIIETKLNLIKNITTTLHNFHFVGSFYIYICVSKRFRQQFIYVLLTIYYNRWCPRRIMNNQIAIQI